MKVFATIEFDIDIEDLDPTQVDIVGLAKDLTENEITSLLSETKLMAGDFEYLTGDDIKNAISHGRPRGNRQTHDRAARRDSQQIQERYRIRNGP